LELPSLLFFHDKLIDGAPGANATGVHLEHSARAAFTAEQWAEPGPVAMLQRSARLTAAICARHGVPVEYVDAAGLRAGKRGITGHVEVSRAFKRSDHFDPGVAFPWAAYLAMVRAAMTA
jgi:N-acetyl-anhydromuramyl-L-alanine amidase AmpD